MVASVFSSTSEFSDCMIKKRFIQQIMLYKAESETKFKFGESILTSYQPLVNSFAIAQLFNLI